MATGRRVSSGSKHTCGVRADRSLWCWGSNYDDQLGLGEGAPSTRLVPTRVGTDTDWVKVYDWIRLTAAGCAPIGPCGAGDPTGTGSWG